MDDLIDREGSGGAIGIEAVDSIPLQHRGMSNPLANDTKSEIPQTPAKTAMNKEMAMANTDMSNGKMKSACMHYMKSQKAMMMK